MTQTHITTAIQGAIADMLGVSISRIWDISISYDSDVATILVVTDESRICLELFKENWAVESTALPDNSPRNILDDFDAIPA